MNYSDVGQGEVVVLVHGFCEDITLWEELQNVLSVHYRVIAVDLPGFGESRLIDATISIESFADSIQQLLKDLNITRCHFIGHSLGGYVGLAFGERYNHNLLSLGLFHSTAFADGEEKKINRNKTIAFIEAHGVATFAQSFVPPLFNSHTKAKYEFEIDRITKVAKNTDPLAVIETTKAMRDRVDRTHILKEALFPILFIIGKDDGAVPLSSSLEQCYLPKDSTIHIYADCGHMGMLEKQKETQSAILSFLKYVSAL